MLIQSLASKHSLVLLIINFPEIRRIEALFFELMDNNRNKM